MSDRSIAASRYLRHDGVRLLIVVIALSAGVSSSAYAQTLAAPAAAPAPLSITIGDVDFTLGGVLDAAAITRSTNVGSGAGTTCGSIPLPNTPAGNLSETRLTAQNSRLSLLVGSKVGDATVAGYIEADFLGQQTANALVTTNANAFRMR